MLNVMLMNSMYCIDVALVRDGTARWSVRGGETKSYSPCRYSKTFHHHSWHKWQVQKELTVSCTSCPTTPVRYMNADVLSATRLGPGLTAGNTVSIYDSADYDKGWRRAEIGATKWPRDLSNKRTNSGTVTVALSAGLQLVERATCSPHSHSPVKEHRFQLILILYNGAGIEPYGKLIMQPRMSASDLQDTQALAHALYCQCTYRESRHYYI
jgi:hypothetical protein